MSGRMATERNTHTHTLSFIVFSCFYLGNIHIWDNATFTDVEIETEKDRECFDLPEGKIFKVVFIP
jgi:hypothetical protein